MGGEEFVDTIEYATQQPRLASSQEIIQHWAFQTGKYLFVKTGGLVNQNAFGVQLYQWDCSVRKDRLYGFWKNIDEIESLNLLCASGGSLTASTIIE